MAKSCRDNGNAKQRRFCFELGKDALEIAGCKPDTAAESNAIEPENGIQIGTKPCNGRG